MASAWQQRLQGGRDVKYGPEVDLWSCGVILFILLSGEPPFYADNDQALYKLIRSGAYRFQDPVWDLVSDECVPASQPHHLPFTSLVAILLRPLCIQ